MKHLSMCVALLTFWTFPAHALNSADVGGTYLVEDGCPSLERSISRFEQTSQDTVLKLDGTPSRISSNICESASAAPAPAPVPGSGPFLGLSFQGLSLNIGARTYNGGGWTDVVGTDLVYGNTSPRYPTGIWGGKARAIDSLQMIWNSPSDVTRQIVTDNSVPAGVSNKVFRSTFVMPYVAPTQDSFQIFPDVSQPQGMLYISKWMWLQPDLASRGGFWFMFMETKTNGASVGGGDNPERFGIGLVMAAWTKKQIIWQVSHDGWINGVYKSYALALLSPSSFFGSMVAGQTNYAPVPLGQWFHIEFALNRSMNGTGWIWAAINGVQVFAQSGAFNFTWNGVTQSVGWNKATPDPIDRIFPFAAYSNLTRSPTNPYSIEQTNIEVWTDWPSNASPHPAGFN